MDQSHTALPHHQPILLQQRIRSAALSSADGAHLVGNLRGRGQPAERGAAAAGRYGGVHGQWPDDGATAHN